MDVVEFNQLSEEDAANALRRCCASQIWVRQMLSLRPFADFDAVKDGAQKTWWQRERQDWLEAFAAHPKIGTINSLKRKYGGVQAWAEVEQGGVSEEDGVTLKALAACNAEYEKKFGFIFIVCATGKSAGEMLAILKERLGHTAAEEIMIAAREQLKITLLRLEKL